MAKSAGESFGFDCFAFVFAGLSLSFPDSPGLALRERLRRIQMEEA